MKATKLNEILQTWIGLNEVLMSADEKLCEELLLHERHNKCRKQFVFRIHSRLNKVRADREREELNEELL